MTINHSTLFENKLVELIEKYDPPLRRRKLCTLTTVRCLQHILSINLSWRQTRDLLRLPISHTTLFKRFVVWVRSGVISSVWNELLALYASQQLKEDPAWFKDLFIDSTHVRNIQGQDTYGKNALDRGRNNTKVSAVCDQNGVVLSSQLYPSNYNDSLTTLRAHWEIPAFCIPDKRRRTNLIGDKGYVAHHVKNTLKSRRCNLITPNKKNQRQGLIAMTPANIKRLKRRQVIENVFMRLDSFKRLLVRYDHKCVNFEAFHQLAYINSLRHVFENARNSSLHDHV